MCKQSTPFVITCVGNFFISLEQLMLLHMILLFALIFFSTFCTEPSEENKLK